MMRALVVLVLALVACKPRYPACENDDQCPGNGEICINGQCQECRGDIHCAPGSSCIGGRCEVAETILGVQQEQEAELAAAPADCMASLPVAFFAFDSHELSEHATIDLEDVATCLKASGGAVLLEGHGDERGTEEYNLGLGERRARTVKRYLAVLGVDDARMTTQSVGENHPVCDVAHEGCWSRNRRVVIVAR